MNVIGVSCPEFSKTPFDEICWHWEIFSELNHFGPLVAEKYTPLIESSDMTFSLHTGIADINIASTNESIRRASVGNVLSEMESAHSLGID
ncbi:MAG: sugar phosphate isomerase/epimerase, partial [Candidatus Methanomethylophilus sp.]|nr:sugar phosphate isomerase/epimerase [Methanomethylophilus sp.]